MKNVKIETTKAGLVTITFDPKSLQGLSASGKSMVVATTEGNIEVPGFPGLKLGVNAYCAKSAAPEAPKA